MFTINQIKAAHSKVKSGADFPAYIQELKALGVTRYEYLVPNGDTEYYGAAHNISSGQRYATLPIAGKVDSVQFLADLKAHQQGKTDFSTFCDDCAKSGVTKWIVSIQDMTCTYIDGNGKTVLAEQIPS